MSAAMVRALTAVLLLASGGCALRGADEARRTMDEVLADPAPVHDPADLVRQRDPAAQSADQPTEARPAPSTEPLKLDGVLMRARRTSEQIRATGETLHQAYLRRLQALADLLPEVGYRQSYFREEDDFPTQEAPGGVRFGALLVEQRTGHFEARQPLFYLSGYLALLQASSVIDLAESQLRAERLLVDQAATALFYAALKLDRQIATLEAAAARDRERRREIQARAETGLARRTEVLFVATDLARTEAALAEGREQLAATRAQLALAMGAPVEGDLEEPTADAMRAPAALATRALPELIEEAHARRPDLAATRAQVDVADGLVSVALGDYAPRLDLTSNYYVHRDGTLEDVDWDVTVDLSAPIFEGLRTTAQAREAQSRKRQAQLLYQAQARAIAQDVTGAYHALRASTAARASREETVKSADENFRLLEAEYRLGIASNLELVTAQQELTQARLDFETERLDEQRLAYELAFLLGGLDRDPGDTASRADSSHAP